MTNQLSCEELRAALAAVAGETACAPIGDELLLVSFPVHYADGDPPQVLVHFNSSTPRLEDFGNGIGRLRGLGLDPDASSIVHDALHGIVWACGLELDSDAITLRVDIDEDLGPQISRLITGLLQVDALRHSARTEVQHFADRVVEWLETNHIVPIVEPRHRITVDSREYQVTARLSRSVEEYEAGEHTFLQAIADRTALMRAHFVLGDLPVPEWRKVAVLHPERLESLAPLIPRLAEIATVGAWSESRRLAMWLRGDDEARQERGRELLSQWGLFE